MLKTKLIISPLFFAVLTAFLLLDKNGIACEAVLFSLLHEMGHFLALLCIKKPPQSVEINVFGIRLNLLKNMSTAKKCFVLMAGFSVNFIIASLCFFTERITEAYINLFIGIFTALPLAATDGGEILKIVLEEIYPQKSEKLFNMISIGFLSAVFALLIFAFAYTKNWFVLMALIYMALCALKNAA